MGEGKCDDFRLVQYNVLVEPFDPKQSHFVANGVSLS